GGTPIVAVAGGSLYISGTKGDAIDGGDNDTFPPAESNGTYRNLVYRVPTDGSCADEGCARAVGNVVDLPTLLDYSFPDPARAVGVTALAAGFSGGNLFVAIGMTDYGVRVYKGDLSSYSEYGGMATANGSQTPVSALAFDPSGSGLLAVGVVSIGIVSLTLTVNPDGSNTGTQGSLVLLGGDDLEPFPLSVTFGRRATGTNVAAFGYNSGGVLLADPHQLGAQAIAGGGGPAGISAINAIPRTDGSGFDDYAIAMQTSSDVAGPMIGQLMSWTVGTEALAAQPVTVDTAGNSSNLLPDRTSFLNWFPGYKQGRFQLKNNSSEPVTVQLKALPEAAYGCWWAGTWADGAGPFPTTGSGVTLDPGDTSDPYVMGAYTGGAKGLCGTDADDVTGDWRGYLVITPVGRPADTKLVNVQLGRNWAVDISDQTEGSTTVTGSRIGQGGAFGSWMLTVDTPAAPTLIPPAAGATVPIVTASAVTSSKRNRATVYRFDVSAMTWTVPGATTPPPPGVPDNASTQVLIPPLQVQGTNDGITWLPIGSFMPVGKLSRSGQVITVGDPSASVGGGGTFFWENPLPPTRGPNSPLLPVWTQIRVVAGTQASAPVVLSSLTPPDLPSTAISSVTISAGSDPTTGAAVTPAPNGVDQSRLQVALTAGGVTLPANDPGYRSVYYRTDGDNLVTNLYDPTAYDEFVGVQPLAGAGSALTKTATRGSGSVPVPAYDYLSTTSTTQRSVTAYVGLSVTAKGSQTVTVEGTALDINPAGTAAPGFSLEGCADFKDSTTGTCYITPVADGLPALYQAGSDATGPIIGAQLSYPARNSVADLPMEWQAKNGKEYLTKASLQESSVKAQLPDDTAFLSTDDVDVNLVSHGQPVPAGNVPATVNVGSP
ncbi:MAG: hypothetical protein ABWY56_06605, partial [Propionibacteriaceae bacterium]